MAVIASLKPNGSKRQLYFKPAHLNNAQNTFT